MGAIMESTGASLRVLFEAGTLAGLGDDRLLEIFRTGGRGEAERAFAVLVERHGPMVLGVCEAVLANREDAEDAFQAVFLVLAQRAGTIRRGAAVSSWLYGVARRVSLRLRRTLARRQRLEERRVSAERIPVTTDMKEPCPEIYEEVDRLPESFRAAVVLCDLEGASYEGAASQLGCPIGTLQSRLARGRKRLRERLVKRGFGPELFASVVPVAPSLVGRVARMAATVAAGESAAMLLPTPAIVMAAADGRRTLAGYGLASVLVLGAAIAAVSGAWFAGVGSGRVAVSQETQAVIRPATEFESKLAYLRILNENGQVEPGQVVSEYSITDDRKPIWSMATDAAGAVVIPRERLEHGHLIYVHRRDRALAGAQSSHGVIHEQRSRSGTRQNPYVLRFHPLTHDVEGTVVDPLGKPIKGVRVVAQGVVKSANNEVLLRINLNGNLRIPGLPDAFTDEAGRFRILLPEGATVTMQPYHERYYGPEVTAEPGTKSLSPLVMRIAGAIVGRVLDARTGSPAPTAGIIAQLMEETGLGYRVVSSGQADADGRFEIRGLPPGVYGFRFSSTTDGEDVSAPVVLGVRVRAGQVTAAGMEIVKRRSIHGVVTDRATGKLVAGQAVRLTGPENPEGRGPLPLITTTTDSQGRFEFRVIPGHYTFDIPARRKGEFVYWGETSVDVPEAGGGRDREAPQEATG